MRRKKAVITNLIIFMCLAFTHPVLGTEVSYYLEELGGGQWVYNYTLTNNTLGLPIEQFIIWFEADKYENLSIVSAPEIGYEWYQDTIEPDPIWLDDGAYRALAYYDGILPDDTETGFAVRFTYLDVDVPGPQEFDIVDPVEYVSLEWGLTHEGLWVDANAAGSPEQWGTFDEPFATIQQGIDAVSNGGAITVRPGTYVENVDFAGKEVTVRSTNPYDWDIVNSTIIDGDQTGSCVVFDDNEGPDSVLAGFTLTNGSGTYVDYSSLEGFAGGGVFCLDSSPTILNCIITRNWNWAFLDGGGIALLGDCQALIANCFIVENASFERGGGVLALSEPATLGTSEIINCTIVNNENNGNESDYFDVDSVSSRITINNTVINGGNRSLLVVDVNLVSYCSISKGYIAEEPDLEPYQYDFSSINGNTSAWPRFIRLPGECFVRDPYSDMCIDYVPGDYHLRPDSPCRNVGDPEYVPLVGQTDFDGQPRIMTGRIDIGADELPPEIVVTRPEGAEVWVAGSEHLVEWQSYDVDGLIDISWSDDDGQSWTPAEINVADTGSYFWTLPSVDSNQCLISITAAEVVPYIEYIHSEENFTIHPSPPGPAVTSEWETESHNFGRTGLSENSGPILGCIKWAFETDGPVTAGIALGANGRAHIACEDGNIYTVSPEGLLEWSYDVNSPLYSSPSVGADGTVYVGAENGKLYAIDANGVLRWTHSTNELIYSSPAVSSDGKVFFGSADGKLYALGSDGSELWSFATAKLGWLNGSILTSPAIGNDGAVYIGGLFDPNLYALDPNDGSIKWACNFASPIDPCDPNTVYVSGRTLASPVVAQDGTIYMALIEDPNLYAIDPNDGDIIWTANLAEANAPWMVPKVSEWSGWDPEGPEYYDVYTLPPFTLSTPALGPDGTIYVSFEHPQKPVWSWLMGVWEGSEYVFVNSDKPHLRAVNPDGSIKWVQRIGSVGVFTMAVGGDGLIYAAGDDAQLYVIDSNGFEVARFRGIDGLAWPVIDENETLYVSDANNTVWAISQDSCDEYTADLHWPEDLNGDRIVNLTDLALLSADWWAESDLGTNGRDNGDKYYLAGDVDSDLRVDFNDLYALVQQWLAMD